ERLAHVGGCGAWSWIRELEDVRGRGRERYVDEPPEASHFCPQPCVNQNAGWNVEGDVGGLLQLARIRQILGAERGTEIKIVGLRACYCGPLHGSGHVDGGETVSRVCERGGQARCLRHPRRRNGGERD